ncbi:unnamed protein product [Mytilus coruscus]|uniref:Uncharacterized protein n=1 Tax=Mytilus coruscus TaxID=42192 RepID=A0A6J8AG72_MYTCO|nr:unnamed protein product [Mytilus coruscus]
MNTARRGMQMKSFVAGLSLVELGTHTFIWDIYVAPIGDDMLLGIDFLKKQGISLDLKKDKLSIHGEVVQMSWGPAEILARVTEVQAAEDKIVPANSVKRVVGLLTEPMGRERPRAIFLYPGHYMRAFIKVYTNLALPLQALRPEVREEQQMGNTSGSWGAEAGFPRDMPSASDNNMHLDRSLVKCGLSPRTSLGDFLRMQLYPAPANPVKLAGGVVVFCDPKTCPSTPLRLEQSWVGAVGIHPKSAANLQTPSKTCSTHW